MVLMEGAHRPGRIDDRGAEVARAPDEPVVEHRSADCERGYVPVQAARIDEEVDRVRAALAAMSIPPDRVGLKRSVDPCVPALANDEEAVAVARCRRYRTCERPGEK